VVAVANVLALAAWALYRGVRPMWRRPSGDSSPPARERLATHDTLARAALPVFVTMALTLTLTAGFALRWQERRAVREWEAGENLLLHDLKYSRLEPLIDAMSRSRHAGS
jgi:hypothetical protein